VSLNGDSRRRVDLEDACVHLVWRLIEGQSLVIRITFSGLAGDSAIYSPERQLFSSGRARARLAATEEIYRTGLKYREIHRIADRYFMTHEPHCMAYCMGLANRTLLPPFMPSGRNQDGVFGALLLSCAPDTLFSHLPLGIIHDSDRPPTYDGPENQSASETRLSELLISLIQRGTPSDLTVAALERIKRIAGFFKELADTSPQDFQSYATRAALDTRYRELTVIEAALSKRSEYPGYWKAGFSAYRHALLTNVGRPDFFVPVEFQQRSSVESGFRQTQEFVRAFGRLLDNWPTLWSTFREADIIRR
jgi:alkylhydroperoxidase/carboxymuconolactone decarboxylase family protein YurZ